MFNVHNSQQSEEEFFFMMRISQISSCNLSISLFILISTGLCPEKRISRSKDDHFWVSVKRCLKKKKALSYSCKYQINSNDRDQEQESKEVCITVTGDCWNQKNSLIIYASVDWSGSLWGSFVCFGWSLLWWDIQIHSKINVLWFILLLFSAAWGISKNICIHY